MARLQRTAIRDDVSYVYFDICNEPAVLFEAIRSQKGFTTFGPATFSCSSDDEKIVAAVAVTNSGPPPYDFELRVFLATPGGTENATGGEVGLNLGGSGALVALTFRSNTFAGGVVMRVSQGEITPDDGSVSIRDPPPRMEPPGKLPCNRPRIPRP